MSNNSSTQLLFGAHTCSLFSLSSSNKFSIQVIFGELSQDSIAHLTCALPINLLIFMIHNLDLKVTQVGHDGTA